MGMLFFMLQMDGKYMPILLMMEIKLSAKPI